MTIRELKERIMSWHSNEMDFCIEDVFSWRGIYAEPCCSISTRTVTKYHNIEQLDKLTTQSFFGYKGEIFKYSDNQWLNFEEDYHAYTCGGYLIKFICANSTPIVEHLFG